MELWITIIVASSLISIAAIVSRATVVHQRDALNHKIALEEARFNRRLLLSENQFNRESLYAFTDKLPDNLTSGQRKKVVESAKETLYLHD